jgi:hypothetical protein
MGSMELVASAMGEEGHLPLFLSSCKPFTFGKAYAQSNTSESVVLCKY